MPPVPPPEHSRFRPGHSGNPGGKTSAQRRLEVQNAEKATRIRAALLDKLTHVLDSLGEGETVAGIEDFDLSPDLLKLLRDSEDRGLGAPVQPVDLSANISALSDDEITAEIARLSGGAPEPPPEAE